MKREHPNTSQSHRNVRRCGPSRRRTPHLPHATQRCTSLQEPRCIQSMASNENIDHQSPTSAPGSTAPQVLVHPQILISAGDERGVSVSSEAPPTAYEPLIRSMAPHLTSQIPGSEERQILQIVELPACAQRNDQRCGPSRHRTPHLRRAAQRRSTTALIPVHPRNLISTGDERGAVSAEVPPSASEPLVGSVAPHPRSHIPASEEGRLSHTVELPEDAQTMAPHLSGELENDYNLSSNENFFENLYQEIQVLTQNPEMLDEGERIYLTIMNELLSEGRLFAQGEPITEVNTGLQTSDLSNFVKKMVCCGEQDQAEHCVICLEHYDNGDEMGQLKCSHKYHFSCICKWMEHQKVCPLCRRRAAPF